MFLKTFRWYDWGQILLPILVAGLFVAAVQQFQIRLPPVRIGIDYTKLNFQGILPILSSGVSLSLLILWHKKLAHQRRIQEEVKLEQTIATINEQQQHEIQVLYQSHQENLQQLENSKDETFRRFLENLEHELRNDLATIKSALRNLGDIPNISSSPSYRTSVLIIEKMQDLIMELRQISAASDWVLEDEIDIVALVTEVVEICQEQVVSANRKIEVDIPNTSKLPWHLPEVLGDYRLLSRAIRKLLENAVKYGRDENIFVKISEDRVSTQSFVKIEIIDKGLGIAKEDLPYIFEPLYRSKKHQNQITGKGVGLALAATIIKKHNGTIDTDSREGQGTIMLVRLPARVPTNT